MKKLKYGLQLLAFLSLFGSIISFPLVKPKVVQIKSPPITPLNAVERSWATRVRYATGQLEFWQAASTASQCFGNLALVLAKGGTAVCKISGPNAFTMHFDRDEPTLMPEDYQRAQRKVNNLLFEHKLLPKALKPRLMEDPGALAALIALPARERRKAENKLGRMLAEENARDDQKALFKAIKAAVLSVPRSKRAAKDNKNIDKWWKKAHSKSIKKGKISSLDQRAEADDDDGVSLIVGFIFRQAFGSLLDVLDDDPYYGVDPDEDDIPKNLLSKTTKWKNYPAIFKGDEPVPIQEADFYVARKILHPDNN